MKKKNSENSEFLISVDQLMPESLYIFPLKQRPIFPGIVTPVVIPPGRAQEILSRVLEKTSFIGFVLLKDDMLDEMDISNLYMVGTSSKVIKRINLPDGGMHLLINTIYRFRVKQYEKREKNIVAQVEYYKETDEEKKSNHKKEIKALTRAVITGARDVMSQNPLLTEEMKLALLNVDESGKIADFTCNILSLDKKEFQNVLETFSIRERLEKTLQFLHREMEMIKLQNKIQNQINNRMENQQKEYFLREQLKEIKTELGLDSEGKEKGAEYYRKKTEKLELSAEAREKVNEEISKLEYVDTHSNEYSVIRNYLDIIIDLPWAKPVFRDIDITKAAKILNRDHYGLEDIKERIIEHIAVIKLRKNAKGTIICLVGPPGVGKTSLGKSIAASLGKKFFRFSLGGMRDEAEIKGHRRTYVGAMPGKVMGAFRVVKEKDPVIMLDEIDKLGVSFQGDPASALLEVLDPEQNQSFRDHYLDIPFDLSFTTFITTANTLDTIPPPLLDRMEIIRLSGYVLEEKMNIARKYIIPRMIKENGLSASNAPRITQNGLKELINGYSREAGVRSLEQHIKKVYRKAAAALVSGKEFPSIIDGNLEAVLGPARFTKKENSLAEYPGTAIGLAWTQMGGATLIIEANAVPGRGRVRITGQLGKVMNESVEIAMTVVRSIVKDEKYWMKNDFHIHVPDGATPKDGPSAGITMTTALLSLYRKAPIKKGFAMTGEIRLSGDVLPIGGLKEKTIAAKRAGIKNIIFPEENLKDWKEMPDFIKKGISFHPVSRYAEVETLVFGEKIKG